MITLPKEIWDEIAVQSLLRDAEEVFTVGKMGDRFENLMIVRVCDESDRLWCIRQFTLLHLPFLVKKAHTEDLNKWWFVDFIEARRIKFKNPMAIILCTELVNHLRLGTSREWFHNLWDKALDEWVLEQPKETNVLLRLQSIRFLDAMESFFVHRPEYINWVNPYSLWISEKIAIPLLSIDSFKMWLHQEFNSPYDSFQTQLRIPQQPHPVYVKLRYAQGLEQHFAFVHNKPRNFDKNYYEYFKIKYDLMWGMMDIFWAEDQKLPIENRLFEHSPWIEKVMGDYEEFDFHDFYGSV